MYDSGKNYKRKERAKVPQEDQSCQENIRTGQEKLTLYGIASNSLRRRLLENDLLQDSVNEQVRDSVSNSLVDCGHDCANDSVNKTGIPDAMKEEAEQRSGFDLDEVRVHYNSTEPDRLGALAYTKGTEVFLRPGQEENLPHELWHVVQQMQGKVKQTGQIDGKPVNFNETLEKEADASLGCAGMKTGYRMDGGEAAGAQSQEAVIQCRPDVAALIDTLCAEISKSGDHTAAINELQAVKTEVLSKEIQETPEALEKVKRVLDQGITNIPVRSGLYEKILDAYGFDVRNQLNKDTDKILSYCFENKMYPYNPEEPATMNGMNFDEFCAWQRAEHKSDLIHDLNVLYGTKTGAELLDRIAKPKNDAKRTELVVGMCWPPAYLIDYDAKNKADTLLTPEGKAGSGLKSSVGSISRLENRLLKNSPDPEMRKIALEEEDMPAALAHELIHVLHAQMGVVPDKETLKKAYFEEIGQGGLGSLTLDRMMDEMFAAEEVEAMFSDDRQQSGLDMMSAHRGIFSGATPDDVPVTGILKEKFRYPEPLAEVAHLNENQIRKELKRPLRKKY